MRRRRYLMAMASGPLLAGCSQSGQTGTNGDGSPSTNETPTPGSAESTRVVQSPIENGGGWPRFQYDLANTGHDANGVLVDDVTPAWIHRLDPDVRFWTAPPRVLVADGTIYTYARVADRDSVDRQEKLTLFAIALADGEIQWRKTWAEEQHVPSEYPAVDQAHIYVLTGDHVRAIDREDGAENWSVSGEYRVTPVAVDGLVITGTGDMLVALDQEDGTEQWRVDAALSRVVNRGLTVAVANSTLYCGTESGLRTLSLDTGEEVLATSSGLAVRHPTVAGEYVVGVTDTSVVARELESGDDAWRVEGPLPKTDGVDQDNHYVGSPATDGSRVFLNTDHNIIRAVSLQTGELRWETDIVPSGYSSSNYAPRVIGDQVFVKKGGNRYHQLNPETGEQQPFLYGPDEEPVPSFELDGTPRLYTASLFDGVVLVARDNFIGAYRVTNDG